MSDDGRKDLRARFKAFGLEPIVRMSKEGVADFLRWREQRRSVHRISVTGRLEIGMYDRDPLRGDDGRVLRAPDGGIDWSHAKMVGLVPAGLNIVTNNGLGVMAHVLGVDADRVATYDIVETAVGTGNTAETATDTDIEAEVFRDTFDDVSYSGGSVTFEMVVEQAEPVSEPVTLYESGLFSAGDTLVARKTYGALSKTSDFAFAYKWKITLARA